MSSFMYNLAHSATPLVLASIGALFTELAGVLGIFLEGFMNMGAFFSWILAVKTGSMITGTLVCALAAALCGWALARFVRKTGANPFIAGLAVNIAAGGITDTLSTIWFGTKGVIRGQAPPVYFPDVYTSWFVVAAAAFVIGYTPWGLRLRASGLAPQAALERGIRPGAYWDAAWAVAAFLAAVAGASISQHVGAYTPGGVAGRGWMGLAAVYLGFRSPGGVFIA
ncbi:MAG: ABC transporter permease, partial [Treponema sp.]|nr:ABC transporter permease [Treponema sp.]